MGKLTEAILQVYGKTLLTKPMPRVEIKLDPPVCTNCNNVLAHNSFHDCFGHYDEVRYILGETSSPRSFIKNMEMIFTTAFMSTQTLTPQKLQKKLQDM